MQVIVDAHLYFIIKLINHRSCVILKAIYGGPFFGRVDYPAFTHPRLRIKRHLGIIVQSPAGRRHNFNNKVWCTGATSVCQFIFITDDRYIWFHPILIIGIQVDGERSWIDFTGTMVISDKFSKNHSKLRNQFLVYPAWGSHIVELPVNQFSSFVIWKIPLII